MTMRERLAKAAFERSMAQLKARFPVSDETLITDETWETTSDDARVHWRGAIDVILDELTANPGDAVLDAAILEHPWYTERETAGNMFCAMIRAIKENK